MAIGALSAGRPGTAVQGRRRRGLIARRAVGGFYLFTGGVHVGIAVAGPKFYRHFADGALFDFVASGWQNIFMAHPTAWGLVTAAGEAFLGLLLLRGGTWARLVWGGVVARRFRCIRIGVSRSAGSCPRPGWRTPALGSTGRSRSRCWTRRP